MYFDKLITKRNIKKIIKLKLINGISVKGTLLKFDCSMNLYLKEVLFIGFKKTPELKYNYFFLKGESIESVDFY